MGLCTVTFLLLDHFLNHSTVPLQAVNEASLQFHMLGLDTQQNKCTLRPISQTQRRGISESLEEAGGVESNKQNVFSYKIVYF